MSNDINISNSAMSERKYTKRMNFSLNDLEIQNIWDYVCEFIEATMFKQKGVSIPNFGTFSFNQIKLDVGQNKFVLLQRPVFLLSEKVCQTHCLTQNKTQITGSIPVIKLNYSAIMLTSSFSRDQVETCVRELITATNNSIANQSGTELIFTKIGRLQIRNQQVKFKFYKTFISVLDSSGKVITLMQNRPSTADSVISERPPTRPFSSIIPLPRINGSNEVSKLPPISETEMFQFNGGIDEGVNILNLSGDEELGTNDKEVTLDESGVENLNIFGVPQQEYYNKFPEDLCGLDSLNYGNNLFDSSEITKNSQTFVNEPIVDCREGSIQSSTYNYILENKAEMNGEVNNNNKLSVSTLTFDGNSPLKPLPTPKPPSRSSLVEDKRLNSAISSQRPISTCSSVCGHSETTGQELCYLCYQREKRNIPISFSEQLKEREKEEERVLQSFQNMKDTEHLMSEQEKLLAKKYDSQKMSAFNLGVAESIRSQQKAKDPNMYRSYIFEHRALTPPKIIKQTLLSSELGKQVEHKENVKKRSQEEESFMERLEQMQLAEDLSRQREQYLLDKDKQKDLYKKALDTQVTIKPAELPKCQPESDEPVFGKNDVTTEKLLEKRLKAQDILKDQIECAERKKKESLIKKIQEQKYEEKILDKTKHDLLEDRARRYQKAMANRKNLEKEWSDNVSIKKERDLVERLKISLPDDLLMHEQCDRYKRCDQCKRKLQNHGQSNIWKDTYFVPGTRYIY